VKVGLHEADDQGENGEVGNFSPCNGRARSRCGAPESKRGRRKRSVAAIMPTAGADITLQDVFKVRCTAPRFCSSIASRNHTHDGADRPIARIAAPYPCKPAFSLGSATLIPIETRSQLAGIALGQGLLHHSVPKMAPHRVRR
jgi:hypothetical protein